MQILRQQRRVLATEIFSHPDLRAVLRKFGIKRVDEFITPDIVQYHFSIIDSFWFDNLFILLLYFSSELIPMPVDATPNGKIEYVEDEDLEIQGLRYQRAVHFSSGDRIFIKSGNHPGQKRGAQDALEDDEDEDHAGKKQKVESESPSSGDQK